MLLSWSCLLCICTVVWIYSLHDTDLLDSNIRSSPWNKWFSHRSCY